MEEECCEEEDLLCVAEETFVCVNLKRPLSFWPNWEADVERERVPEAEEKVGELEREVLEVVIVECTATIPGYFLCVFCILG